MCVMEFVKIQPNEAEYVYRQLEKCFIKDELRDYDDYLTVLNDDAYLLAHITLDGKRVGFVGLWQLNGFTFVEHFAIYEQLRGNGYGGMAIDALQRQFGKIVLEIEPPIEPDQIRRLHFYERHGFTMNGFAYMQPSYRPNGNSLPLKLMSFPDEISDHVSVISEIYKKVYKVIQE